MSLPMDTSSVDVEMITKEVSLLMQWLASLFAQGLESLTAFVGDWFLAIVLFTLMVKVALLPLSLKQHKAMLLSRNLTEAKRLLEEKFKDKKEKTNSALTRIMGEQRINPFAPFLPLLIQMPVFFALYFSVSHLTTTLGSFLIPWVLNAGETDPLHIIPVLASLAQGAGALASPAKNLTTFLLPMAIGLLVLWKAPVGVGVYWATNALLGLLEKKLFEVPAVRQRFLKIPGAQEMIEGIS